MSWLEIIVAISGLAIGYWMVSVFVSSRRFEPDDTIAQDGASSDAVGPRHWTAVLELPFDADEAGITSAYRRAMSQHHPDRVATMAPEIQELARRRTVEINAAYDEAMRALHGPASRR